MAPQISQLHFVLIPLMCPGHMIPMVDLGRLLAKHGVRVSIITTPVNAAGFERIINRDAQSGAQIQLTGLPFPCREAGLPDGVESVDALPTRELSRCFMDATVLFRGPVEEYLSEEAEVRPSCLISDRHLPWTVELAAKFGIPRLAFDGEGCFAAVCKLYLHLSKVHEMVSSDRRTFLVPGLPDKIELTRAQLPVEFNPVPLSSKKMEEEMKAADEASFGLVVNSFGELELKYVEEYRKLKGDTIWCIGPVSLCNKQASDKAERGRNKASVDEQKCFEWLHAWPEASVIYSCLGTLCCLAPEQLLELALALEASNRPFIWVIRDGYKSSEFEAQMAENGVEERIRGRGLIIRGWAPQVLILSHPAIGGFLTHCGWNSVMEAICAGVPMVTWPLLAEQFFNERLVVEVLGIGEMVGAESALRWGEEDKYGVMVKRERILRALELVMGEGEGKEIRERVRKLQEMAEMAFGVGGSSDVNVKLLIETVMKQVIVGDQRGNGM